MKDILEDRKLMCTHIFIGVRDMPGICHGGCGLCMKLHRKIRIEYADIRICKKAAYMRKNRICSYEKSTQVCHPIGLMILKTLIVKIVSVHLC